MFKKIVALLIMVSFFYFVGATGVLASNNISVTVKTYAGNSTPAVSTPFDNQARGNQVSITHGNANANGFAFFAVNDTIRPDLSIDHQFKVLSRMSISVIYDVRDNGNVTKHAVVFVDSNRKIIEVQYVAVGQLAVTPSSLPTPPPNMDWKETPWLTADNKSLADVVDSNRIYYAQYELVDTVSSYQLTVVGGTGSGSYAYNSVATITPNAAPEGKVFSHWADAEGNKLSYKSSYKVSILAATSIQAVFVDGATSPAEQPVVSMSDDLGIKGSGFVTYKGQMQLPAGYSIVEYGFIFSRSSDVLTLTSLGATIVPSNIHYSVTGEFMRSFPVETFNSIRAYMIIQNGSNPEEVVYSENKIGSPVESEQIIYQTGFDTSEGFTAHNVYNNTALRGDGPVGYRWSSYYGTASSNEPISGLSAQMRWYTANSDRLGYFISDFTLNNVTKIEFDAKVDNISIGVEVSYSYDKETWIGQQQFELTLDPATKVYTISPNNPVYIKFQVHIPGSNPGGTSKLMVDNLKIYGLTTVSLHEVILNNEGALETLSIPNGGQVNSTPTKVGHTFDGWFTDSAKTIPHNNALIYQSITLYAKFTPESKTLTFNYNGADGGNRPATITADYGTQVDLPEPTRTGYTFEGWGTETFTTMYPSPYTIPSVNRNMYAKWSINQYTITFDSNGGSSVSPITLDFGTSVTKPANPEREGWTFLGWYTDEGTFNNEYNFTTMPANNVPLYANWQFGVFYEVNYLSNGGTSVSSEFVLDGNYAIRPESPTKNGYSFDYWQTEKNVQWQFETTAITSPLTLSAKWSPITYSITYNGIGENENHKDNPSSFTIESANISLQNPAIRVGYTFSGWYDAETGGNKVTAIPNGSTGNKILYARYVVEQQDYTDTLTVTSMGLTSSYTTYTNVNVGNGTFSGRVMYNSQNSINGGTISKIQTNSNNSPFISYNVKEGYYIFSVTVNDVNAGGAGRTLKIGSVTLATFGTSPINIPTYEFSNNTTTSFTLTPSSAVYIGSIVIVCKPLN